MRERRHEATARRQTPAPFRDAGPDAATLRLSRALIAARMGVWECRIADGTMNWDRRTEALFAMSAEDTGPRSLTDWRARLHPDDRASAESALNDALRAGGRLESDFRLVLPGGALRHLRACGTVHPGPAGDALMSGTVTDITA